MRPERVGQVVLVLDARSTTILRRKVICFDDCYAEFRQNPSNPRCRLYVRHGRIFPDTSEGEAQARSFILLKLAGDCVTADENLKAARYAFDREDSFPAPIDNENP